MKGLASKNGAATVQDRIVEVDARTGTVQREWDLGQVFDPTRTTFVDPAQWSPGVDDWLHDNGLAYSAADESIIVSGRHQGVAKIRRDGSLVWLLAPHKGWNAPQSDKLLTAVNAAGTSLNLLAYNHLTPRENLFNQTDLIYKADLGWSRHTLLVGSE